MNHKGRYHSIPEVREIWNRGGVAVTSPNWRLSIDPVSSSLERVHEFVQDLPLRLGKDVLVRQ